VDVDSFENEAGVPVGATVEAVRELAKAEGTMTAYTTTDREAFTAWTEELTATYPYLDVEMVTGGSGELLSRWDSEYRSGQVAADLFEASSTTKHVWESDQHMTLSGEYLPAFAETPDRFKGANGDWIATVQFLGSVFYNTEEVSSDAVTAWEDVVSDDRWGDGALGWDPTPNMFMMTWFLDRYGSGFFEELRGQSPHWVDSHTDLVRQCGAGAFPIAFSYTHKMGRFGEDLPVEYFPLDPHVGTLKTAVINDRAKHPNTALLFLDWLCSREGQEVVGRGQYIPWHPEAAYSGYPDVYPSEEYTVEYVPPDADLERTREVWNRVVDV
jgi:iron(III) transport system substrate-binding protein